MRARRRATHRDVELGDVTEMGTLITADIFNDFAAMNPAQSRRAVAVRYGDLWRPDLDRPGAPTRFPTRTPLESYRLPTHELTAEHEPVEPHWPDQSIIGRVARWQDLRDRTPAPLPTHGRHSQGRDPTASCTGFRNAIAQLLHDRASTPATTSRSCIPNNEWVSRRSATLAGKRFLRSLLHVHQHPPPQHSGSRVHRLRT